MLRVMGLPFEDIRFSYDDLPKFRKEFNFEFDLVPVLEIDG